MWTEKRFVSQWILVLILHNGSSVSFRFIDRVLLNLHQTNTVMCINRSLSGNWRYSTHADCILPLGAYQTSLHLGALCMLMPRTDASFIILSKHEDLGIFSDLSILLYVHYHSCSGVGMGVGGGSGVAVGGGVGGRGRVTFGTGVRHSISKHAPFIYLAFEKTDPYHILDHINFVDPFIYCPLIFGTHLLLVVRQIVNSLNTKITSSLKISEWKICA